MNTHFSEKHNWRKLLMERQYEILDNIDSGSFGEVHTLQKSNDDKIYAVKTIKACGYVTDDEYILAEIRSLLQLKHPHIITMIDLVITQNIACIVMEYAVGGNLERYILNNKPLSHCFILKWFGQLLSAISLCHSCDIAHKDINPSNILIFDDTCVKLADFGLAVKCHDAEGVLVLCEDYLGQNSYLAPEILQHEPHNAMQADIWSLGCVLFYMCYAKPPFEGEVNGIVKAQITTGAQFPPEVIDTHLCGSEVFNEQVTNLCIIAPEERITSAVASEKWECLMKTNRTPTE